MSDTLSILRSALAGRYRVEREIGSGGMAVVYLAHEERHGRRVAIKVLRPELAAAVGAARFLHEICGCASLWTSGNIIEEVHPDLFEDLHRGVMDHLEFVGGDDIGGLVAHPRLGERALHRQPAALGRGTALSA